MSVASKGIWFPIAYNHLHNPTIDQSVDSIKSIVPAAGIHHPCIIDQADDINPHETSSDKSKGNRQASIHPAYWSPIGSKAKATLVDGYTQCAANSWREKATSFRWPSSR
jgi:hypothetical protein